MKLTQILLASTFALATATTFAASTDRHSTEEKVIVSTQEQPETTNVEGAAGQPSVAQPSSEAATQESPAQPAQ